MYQSCFGCSTAECAGIDAAYVCVCVCVCVGKTVFKKPVKLTVTVMPTQTAGAGEPSEANIIFDGKTFTVTFGQTGGVCGGGR